MNIKSIHSFVITYVHIPEIIMPVTQLFLDCSIAVMKSIGCDKWWIAVQYRINEKPLSLNTRTSNILPNSENVSRINWSVSRMHTLQTRNIQSEQTSPNKNKPRTKSSSLAQGQVQAARLAPVTSADSNKVAPSSECHYNFSWMQANWFKQETHKRTHLSRPMTLIFNRVREVVKVHVHAKFQQAKCSGSWVTVEKTPLKTILPSLPWAVINQTVISLQEIILHLFN